MASVRRPPTEKKGHIDPNQAFFNRETAERSEPKAKPKMGRHSDQLIPEAKPKIGRRSDQLIPQIAPRQTDLSTAKAAKRDRRRARSTYVVVTTCHVAARTSYVSEHTCLVATRTKLVGGTTYHVAGRTKHVATRTCHVASRTKLVAARTSFVGASTKPVAARTKSSFDGINGGGREQRARKHRAP